VSCRHRATVHVDDSPDRKHRIDDALIPSSANPTGSNFRERQELAEHGRLAAEQQKLTRFLPWIHHSYLEKGKPAVFHPQLLADFHTIEELGLKMHGELKALPQ
jgi:hypothetical protein